METRSWLEVLAELRERGVACAMVVVTAVRGSAPREVGARMIVAEGRLAWGTIGGGNLERLAIERAQGLIGRGQASAESVDYPLGESTGQCCGGAVSLYLESFPWVKPRVVVFGAGHVGQALAALAGHLSVEMLVIDTRDSTSLMPRPAANRGYTLLFVDAPEAELERLSADCMVLIMTHSHALDFELVANALRRPPFRYLGLIGSERKWTRFRVRLARRGFSAEQIARVRCPIGLVRGSKEPGAIALSAAAELLQVLAQTEQANARG